MMTGCVFFIQFCPQVNTVLCCPLAPCCDDAPWGLEGLVWHPSRLPLSLPPTLHSVCSSLTHVQTLGR